MSKTSSEAVTPQVTPAPTPGRIVLYRMPDGNCPGELRPALVVRVGDAGLSLAVFTCPFADGILSPTPRADVQEGTATGQWSWPVRA